MLLNLTYFCRHLQYFAIWRPSEARGRHCGGLQRLEDGILGNGIEPARGGRRKVRGPSELNLTKSDWYSTRPAPLQAGGGGSQFATRKPPRRWKDRREERKEKGDESREKKEERMKIITFKVLRTSRRAFGSSLLCFLVFGSSCSLGCTS